MINGNSRLSRFFLAMVAGMVAGALAGMVIRSALHTWSGDVSPAGGASLPQPNGIDVQAARPTGKDAALRYAQALKDGDWDTVIDQTLWMRERLDYVQLEGGEEAVTREREHLARRLAERSPEENQLRAEGVEDQFVFAPGVEIAAVGVDAGRDDLERPVAARTWLRVTYPRRAQALRDMQNLPIRALTAGVNVDEKGYVLKAGVIGNLEIDMDSISRDWDMAGGG